MSLLLKARPYLFMVVMQIGIAVMNIVTKMAFDHGMSNTVIVVYRNAIGAAILFPFAMYFEKKTRPKFTFNVFCRVFFLGLVGVTVNLECFYIGLKLTTSTLATALTNLLPAMTFVMAILLRMEKVNLKKTRSLAKVFGTIICVGGAMMMTFYKGPIVPMLHISHHHDHLSSTQSHKHAGNQWLKGAALVIVGTLAWATLFIQQTAVLKVYPAELTLATLMCSMAATQSLVFGFIVERDISKWALGWDLKLIASLINAVAGAALPYYLQGVCMKEKGPVFVTSFVPLSMVLVAIFGTIFLSEMLYLGSVLGGIFITIGLYAVLWGKLEDTSVSVGTEEEKTQKVDTEKVPPV